MILKIAEINKNNVCGIVITYNGSASINNTLFSLINNVRYVIIVDNGSTDNTLEIINSINLPNVFILKNDNNIGIASALNKGAALAFEFGFTWILTMDQDSILDEFFMDEIIKVYDQLSDDVRKMTACLAPSLILQGSKKSSNCRSYRDFIFKDYVITSGNVVNLFYLNHVGGYTEKLFIDSVDFDFCLRLRELNLLVVVCLKAFMFHELGSIKKIKFLIFTFNIHIHTKMRKYYMSRNHVYILKRFYKSNIKFCILKMIFFMLFIFQVIFFEPDKLSNLKTIFMGLKHGIEDNYKNVNLI